MVKDIKININYNLRDPKADIDTPINLVIRYSGFQIVHPSSEKIHPKDWQNDKTKGKGYQRAKKGHTALNSRLDDKVVKIQKLFFKFFEDNNRVPTPKEFKAQLSQTLGQVDVREEEGIGLLDFIEKHIKESRTRSNLKTGKLISPNTIKPYKTVLMHLRNFDVSGELTWDSLSQDFYKKFTDYLFKSGLKINSIGKQWQNINAFIRQAELQEVIPYGKIRSFKVQREQVENISLSEEELKEWANLDLHHCPRLDKVRDIFLVGCHTASRYSDFHKYTPSAIHSVEGTDFFQITQQKTQQKVSVPVHAVVKEIHKKYGNSLPQVPSDQKMNDYLKEIARMIPSLHQPFKKTINENGKLVTIEEPKYNFVSTHTARRTFATNQVKKKVPVYLIMHATGHKTEKDFWKYVKMDNHDKVLQLSAIWNSN